jgi:glycosyltransferase involved in cell wall biosynthesis
MRSERPRLLLVIGSLEGGGAERQMSHVANYWAAKGYEVTLATWTGPDVEDFYGLDGGVRRVHLDVTSTAEWFSSLRASVRRLAKLRKLLAAFQPDAVLSFMTESNVLTILAGVGLGRRVVVSERVQPALHSALPWKWKVLRRAVYAWSDAVVAQTADAARWITRHCRKEAVVIPNMLRPLPQLSVDRQPLILAVGRLAGQKGFDLLLRAFARIAPDFNEWRVTIIGEGSERARLVSLCADLGLSERVTFAGQLRNVESWMARAGIVVQPSRFEGFPNVVLESMGMGAAVISTDCPSGPADLIEDGINGRLVPVENVDMLTRAMVELMSQADLRTRLGQEAARVSQRFHPDAIMAQWEACLFAEPLRSRAGVPSARVDCE